jgi:hypothetical protein
MSTTSVSPIMAAGVVIGGVVVEQVDAAVGGDGSLDELAHRRLLGEVHLHRDGLPAGVDDRAGRLLGGGEEQVADHHGRPLAGQAAGGGRTDARGAAGDDRHLVLEPAHG